MAQPIAGYCLVRELGRGGMGVVWLALRMADGQPVALKTILPAMAGTEEQVDRFLREAAILRELDHPHIVAFGDLGESGGQLYFVMDYVRGRNGAQLLKARGGPLPIDRAVGLVCQLLEALEYAHARGFVHRDIKPANLLVTEQDGREFVKLADFGLARVYQASRLSGLTVMGQVAGTMACMAPEQITDLRNVKPPAEQYSAGATLYHLLTRKPIYDLPRDVRQQIPMILQDDPIPIRSRRPEIPDALAAIVHRSLAREPGARFVDVGTMRRALLNLSPG
ncbi:MAG TPA: serine/threonine-protein kinase [Isosphaeraceae bacterium]